MFLKGIYALIMAYRFVVLICFIFYCYALFVECVIPPKGIATYSSDDDEWMETDGTPTSTYYIERETLTFTAWVH